MISESERQVGRAMDNYYAMQRANGDWYALEDNGSCRVPVFGSSRDAMIARSRDAGMECFRPTALEPIAFESLTTTDQGRACFWLVDNPEMKLSRGRRIDKAQLARLISSKEVKPGSNNLEVTNLE